MGRFQFDAIAKSNEFRPIVIDQLKSLFDKVYKSRPIATKSRHSNIAELEYMRNENSDLLRKGRVHCSTSSWRAQAFVVKNKK